MMQNNTSSLLQCETYDPILVDMSVACLQLLTFPFALVLNGVAVWVSLHLRSTSTFIVYLKHLMVADLLMTLTFPLRAASKLPGATLELKIFSCQYTDVIFNTSLYTSITLMGLISLDRFFKIVKPHGIVFGQNVWCSKTISSLVWVLLIGIAAIPEVILNDQKPPYDNTKSLCMSLKGPAGLTHHRLVVSMMQILFWHVTLLIMFSYVCITMKVLQSFRKSGSNNKQGKKKTKLRVFSILLVYCVCFVPIHFQRISLLLSKNSSGCLEIGTIIAYESAIWLSSVNTCLDPFLYIYLCKEFKEKLNRILRGTKMFICL